MKPYAVTIRILSFRTLVIQADSAEHAGILAQQEWLMRPGPLVEPSAGLVYTVRPLEPLSIASTADGWAEEKVPEALRKFREAVQEEPPKRGKKQDKGS